MIMSFEDKNELSVYNKHSNKRVVFDVPMKKYSSDKTDPDELANQIDVYIKEGNIEQANKLFLLLKKVDKNHPQIERFATALEN